MPTVKLEGDTLGKKCQHFNKLVEDAIANDRYELRNISSDESDVDNLLKIAIASKTRNVDYLIEVMKSNDMLYAATAIKKSTWLITEQQYAHIVNPDYLHTQLLPSMNTKTFNKLMLHIRLNLKDESRVETFYEYLKEKDSACKWLQNCSIPFIENVLRSGRLVSISLFKRLCIRSAHLIEYYKQVEGWPAYAVKQKCLMMLKSHPAELLNTLERDNFYNCPTFNKKKTKMLMKIWDQKVFDNFEHLFFSLDFSVVAKYLNKKDIKAFLYEQVKKSSLHYLCNHNNISPFIANMPEEEKFDFVKKTFIDKTEAEAFYPKYKEENMNQHIKVYQWYEFAPFKIALPELTKILRNENSPSERCATLSVLITCTRKNLQHIKTLLEFFKDKHINEPFKFKIEFINNLLTQISCHELDVESWNILDQLFHSMEVYTESVNDVQLCLESIILYRVLHDEPVPEIVEQKMIFNSFEKIQGKLNHVQYGKLYTYLLNSVLTKIQIDNIANESDFNVSLNHIMNALILLKDWKKDISNYPYILKRIQDLNKIKQENMWKIDMSCLYNVKKSWRKHMFEDSLSLYLCEETCLNALKHKPQILMINDKEIDTLRTNDAVSLKRLLAKLRIYWPHSLAQHWTDAYLLNLNQLAGQKTVIKSLFVLLSQNEIVDFAKKHAPDNFKITWGETDETEISIRKNIAKHLHVARPLIPLDTVLWYSRGDYLQYAMPSLNAILENMSKTDSYIYLPKLLNAQVSLQKCGLNLAASKLPLVDLKPIFLKMWNTSNNLTIRSVLFKHIHAQIYKAKNPTIEKELWEILSILIDNLTSNESADIYKKIKSVQKVPVSIKAEYYMKSYEFLSSLPASANCEKFVESLVEYAPKVMELLTEDFVVNKLLSTADTKFCSFESKYLQVFACFILCGKSEDDQIQRFKKVAEPALDKCFQSWDTTISDTYYVRDNLKTFLCSLVWHFRIYFMTSNVKIFPVKLFKEIKSKIEKCLLLVENYVLITSWKMVTEYILTMYELRSELSSFEASKFSESDFGDKWISNEMNDVWMDIHSKISPILGPALVNCLKKDTEQYNVSTIYCLFTEAFQYCFYDLFYFQGIDFIIVTLKHMLNDNDFAPSYFLVSKMIPKYVIVRNEARSEIREKVKSHPSKAVRMHYYNDFEGRPED